MFRWYCVYLAAWVLLLPLEAGAVKEAVKDVSFQTHGNKVYISYTLEGKGEYEVSLRVSDDGGRTFSIVPKSLSGAVGKGEEPGDNKGIIWDALQDVPSLKGSDFVFEVLASRGSPRRLRGIGVLTLLLVTGMAIAVFEEGATSQETPPEGTIIVEVPDPEDDP